MSRVFRVPGVVVIVGLLVAGLLVDQGRDPVQVTEDDIVSPVPLIAPGDARSATWFCAAATADDGGSAEGQIVLANTTPESTTAVVSVFAGGPEPGIGGVVDELVVEVPGFASVDLRPAELSPGSAVVSIAGEIDGGGVIVDKVVSGPTGVARSSCAIDGSDEWVLASGTTTPGARNQLVVFNPFPDDAVIDVDFVSEAGARSPEDLVAVHVPSQSSRLIEVGDFVAAAATVSTFVSARSGRVVVESIQSFDGTAEPLGLGLVGGVPAPAETWIFAGISPAIGPARLIVVNPGESIVRADVEIRPAGAERFIEPLELTLRSGQQSVVDLLADGRLEGITAFSVVVRSFDGPRIVAGIEQRPPEPETGPLAELIEVEAPSTGFAVSAGQSRASDRLFTTIDIDETDERSALHVYNPSADSFVRIDATIATEGASRVVPLEVGPLRTLRVPLNELSTGRYTLVLDASAALVGAREITGLSSRSWAPLLAEG